VQTTEVGHDGGVDTSDPGENLDEDTDDGLGCVDVCELQHSQARDGE